MFLLSSTYILRSLAALLLYLTSAFAYGQGYWSVDGHTARINLTYPQSKMPKMPITFYVDWDPSSRCAPTIGMIVPKGTSLSMGKFQVRKESTENMIVTVGNRNWESRTILTSYTNAQDATSYAASDLMDALRSSSSVKFQLFRNSPIFDVQLDGARQAIDEAKRHCN